MSNNRNPVVQNTLDDQLMTLSIWIKFWFRVAEMADQLQGIKGANKRVVLHIISGINVF